MFEFLIGLKHKVGKDCMQFKIVYISLKIVQQDELL